MIKTLKIMRNFRHISKEQKIWLILFWLFTVPVVSLPLLEWQGSDIPAKSELQYSLGMLDYSKTREGDVTLALRTLDRLSEITYYGCSHSTGAESSCIRMEKIEPYIGKTAKIGWYSLQDGWVYKNNARQALSLEVEDQQLMTYEEEKHQATKQNKVGVIFFIVSLLLFTFMFEKLIYPPD